MYVCPGKGRLCWLLVVSDTGSWEFEVVYTALATRLPTPLQEIGHFRLSYHCHQGFREIFARHTPPPPSTPLPTTTTKILTPRPLTPPHTPPHMVRPKCWHAPNFPIFSEKFAVFFFSFLFFAPGVFDPHTTNPHTSLPHTDADF